ncbi:MAG: Asp-tRNA(Asn)/Glu-tRNA(Gln) amidotransferase subunit GatC [Clostridia bacterium]|nr:Asp-tRNA(Asn)/Glu-tRNA(Gln) amidotransferase subunit GatC [Clostridia bacterium]MCL6522329.1 Asp-tRNA(Asn)/Glu-tRNA(Gln) amidotransferase subunit GatC [Bacillota bacterium]
MAISPDEVRHVARLARLALDEGEVERLAGELGAILEYVAQLQRVETAGVPPTAHVLDQVNALREDEPGPGLEREVLLEEAPDREGPFWRVPRVIGEGGENVGEGEER